MQKIAQYRGVTLIELMIVITIIAVLAGIAYPSYRNHMLQTRRSDAQVALTLAANNQERYFTQCNYYAATLTGAVRKCGASAGAADTELAIGTNSPDGHYVLSVAAGNIQGTCSGVSAAYTCGYTLVTTPKAGGRQVGNGKLRIDAMGTKQWDKADDNSYAKSWTDK